MLRLALSILIVLSPSGLAQELVKFENGQVADAVDINANFTLLKNEIAELRKLLAREGTKKDFCVSINSEGITVGDQRNLFNVDTQVTVTGWIFAEGDCAPRSCTVFSSEMANSSNNADNTGFSLYVQGSRLIGYIGTGKNITSKWSNSDDGTIPKNRWTHVAMTRNGGSLKLYVNGLLNSEFEVDPESVWFDGSIYEHNFSAIGVQFPNGFSGSSPNLVDAFSGSLSQIGVWNRSLSSADITNMSLHKFDYIESGPAGFWPLDAGQGDLIEDFSGFSNNGTLPESASWSNSCR